MRHATSPADLLRRKLELADNAFGIGEFAKRIGEVSSPWAVRDRRESFRAFQQRLEPHVGDWRDLMLGKYSVGKF